MEPITLPHQPTRHAYVARDITRPDFPLPIPRSERAEALREVWLVKNECAVRSTGLIDGINARSYYRGEWDAVNGRLSFNERSLPPDPATLLLVFA